MVGPCRMSILRNAHVAFFCHLLSPCRRAGTMEEEGGGGGSVFGLMSGEGAGSGEGEAERNSSLALDGESLCRMLILRNVNVTCLCRHKGPN